MRILIIGFLLLAIWTALSTYLYLNKIRDFSVKPVSTQVDIPPALPQPQKMVAPEQIVVYFETDKSALTADEATDRLITGFKIWIEQNPESGILITGHADASGSALHNTDLARKRAQGVMNYLISKGIPSEKITAISKGEDEPVADNTTSEGKAKNRRSEITIK